jgi:hypothetical protein
LEILAGELSEQLQLSMPKRSDQPSPKDELIAFRGSLPMR